MATCVGKVDNIDDSLFTNIIREKGEARTVQSLRVTLESKFLIVLIVLQSGNGCEMDYCNSGFIPSVGLYSPQIMEHQPSFQ